MSTGELAGIPSQVRFLLLDVVTVLYSNLQSYNKTEVAAVLRGVLNVLPYFYICECSLW